MGLITFRELLDRTNLSHNSVSKKLCELGIKPSGKEGRFYLYEEDAVEKVLSTIDPMNTGKVKCLYRVSVFEGDGYYVKAVSLSLNKANALVRKFRMEGKEAKAIRCC